MFEPTDVEESTDYVLVGPSSKSRMTLGVVGCFLSIGPLPWGWSKGILLLLVQYTVGGCKHYLERLGFQIPGLSPGWVVETTKVEFSRGNGNSGGRLKCLLAYLLIFL